MGIDINLFRKEKGGDPEKIKEIQRKRYKPQEEIDRVDKIVELDKEWRKTDFNMNNMNKELNSLSK
jgi:seryl-tRNA synthetase